MLAVTRHGAPSPKPKLLIAHGLYGSGRNWGVIAKRLSEDREVLAVDMRNHAGSFWAESHSYSDLAADLAEVIEADGGPMDVLGHSMGGKASMVLALTRPDLVGKLTVADIAPVTYSHTQQQYIDAMREVDLSRVTRRSDAEKQLAGRIEDRGIRAFILQSLDVDAKKWRLNLDVLEREMPKIIGFPEMQEVHGGPVLFLSGGASDYVLPEHRPLIKARFPKARFAKVPGAGHWLHAENPRAFEANMKAWLG